MAHHLAPASHYKAGQSALPGSSSYHVLYSFADGSDAENPYAELINVKGMLYGTTLFGGDGGGTVFSISTSGVEKVLYSFVCCSDGGKPFAGLINVKGTLYGTNYFGGGGSGCGHFGCGTVFSVSTTGAEKVLHNFAGGTSDGANPIAGLINVKGTLYGTTSGGGHSGCQYDHGCGTVFSISTSGEEKVLYSFVGGTSDGANPAASLVNVKGTLYGTTGGGGSSGVGTVFSISTSGAEKVLHSFSAGSDGANPAASLITAKGTLYGTTESGGSSGLGTVFSISTSGVEKVLHSFAGESDGANPAAGLLSVHGTLYGTTVFGGRSSSCTVCNNGTVYSITRNGAENVLHDFGSAESDGLYPYARLLYVKGMLYGTTYAGGSSGFGTVFALAP